MCNVTTLSLGKYPFYPWNMTSLLDPTNSTGLGDPVCLRCTVGKPRFLFSFKTNLNLAMQLSSQGQWNCIKARSSRMEHFVPDVRRIAHSLAGNNILFRVQKIEVLRGFGTSKMPSPTVLWGLFSLPWWIELSAMYHRSFVMTYVALHERLQFKNLVVISHHTPHRHNSQKQGPY